MKRIYTSLGIITLMVLIVGAGVGVTAYLLETFAWQFLSMTFATKAQFREACLILGILLLMPMILIVIFKVLPGDAQETVLETSSGMAGAINWVGKGFLFAAGVCIFFYLANL